MQIVILKKKHYEKGECLQASLLPAINLITEKQFAHDDLNLDERYKARSIDRNKLKKVPWKQRQTTIYPLSGNNYTVQ